ncbi:MAG: hypothetical protein KC613_15255 [Myxococcales bacterium]|nr:hypothetical protein [Myxococcales bacterium]MCB9522096.1 phosphoribosylaminoimidazolesuccinocarboxamide synthase [Myxococcales bacterium]
MSDGELLYTGSVKRVFSVPGHPDRVRFQFSDRISVFDKWIPNTVPDKGEVICRTAAFWFRALEEAGVPTHFIDQPSPTELIVKRITVEHDYARMAPGRPSVLLPCEFIIRHYAAGSFYDRMQGGALPDFPPDSLEYGDELEVPFCETSTKVEPTDRLIDEAEALRISGMSDLELEAIWAASLRIDEIIATQVIRGGLIHADGKKEWGRDADGELMLVDVLGTPDEDRWWDAEAWSRGEVVQLSKEFVRQHYRETGYKDALYAARVAGAPEPEIPPMPDALVAQARALYIDLFERITQESFR